MVPLGALRSEIYLEMSRGGRLSAPFLIVRSYVAVLCEELGSQLSRTSAGSLDVYGIDADYSGPCHSPLRLSVTLNA